MTTSARDGVMHNGDTVLRIMALCSFYVFVMQECLERGSEEIKIVAAYQNKTLVL